MELNNNNMEVSHLFPQALARFRAPNEVIQAAMSVIDPSMGVDQRALWQYINDCANEYAIDVLGVEGTVFRDFDTIKTDKELTFTQGDYLAFGVYAVHVPKNICRIEFTNPELLPYAENTTHRYNTAHLFISKNELIIFTSAPKIIPPVNQEDSIFITFKIKYYVD